ncbi:MAG: hypothetical protein JXR69_08510 [Candidatus Delongbacteria bacterium]|nr:hypothetical protein [Candidatus Delongbacteria bacterium]
MKNDFLLIFNISDSKIQLTEKKINGFVNRISSSEILITNLKNELDNATDMSKFRGVKIEFTERSLSIYTDHFSSIPVFYTNTGSQVIFSNNYKYVASNVIIPTEDKIGFWELFIFENTLLDRTLLQEVKYLQACSLLHIENNSVKESRYFNYDYEKISGVSANNYDEMIDTIRSYFKELEYKEYLFPVSGGFDSRLFLSLFDKEKYINEFVTYGFNKNIIENAAAKKVIDLLGYDRKKHIFHKLTEDKYMKDIVELSEISGGFIGVQNSHLFSYLSDVDPKGSNLISGVLADGIFGYACDPELNNEFTKSSYYKTIINASGKYRIPQKITDEIISDLEKLFTDWKLNRTISSFNEYVYIRERNSKFMFGLVNVWRRYTNVIIPPLDHRIENLFMSLPDSSRKYKAIVNRLLNRIDPKLLNINNVSSIFRNKEIGLSNKCQDLEYRIIRKLNSIIQGKIKLPVNFPNRFDTETHDYYYLKYHRDIIKNDVIEFKDKNPGFIPDDILENIEGMRAYQLYSNIHVLNENILERT